VTSLGRTPYPCWFLDEEEGVLKTLRECVDIELEEEEGVQGAASASAPPLVLRVVIVSTRWRDDRRSEHIRSDYSQKNKDTPKDQRKREIRRSVTEEN
jgi:hypothetical protein